jgi:CheY-like chemotaxis protein
MAPLSLTNAIQAIKFTRTESTRSITIRFGASAYHRPKPLGKNIRWFPTDKPRADLTANPEWGTGDPLYLYFSVTDTGRGLEEDETTRLFNKFAQASPRTHVEYGGSGLGLFISRELTEMQGGQIGVHSKVGEGSTFAYYIKSKRAPAPLATVSKAETGRGKKASTEDLMSFRVHRKESSICKGSGFALGKDVEKPQNENAARFHVLLVEDNLINQKVLSKQLAKAGCSVIVANHGVEALEQLQKTTMWDPAGRVGPGINIDVVLMDVEMPVMDGLTCTKKIRELERQGTLLRRLNVVAITANARAEQIMVIREAGVVRHTRLQLYVLVHC